MGMGEGDSIHDRRRALEEAFFSKRDQELLEKMRKKMSAEETEKVLSVAIGIADTTCVHAITRVEAGVQVLTVLALLPLVEVAWSDGDVSAQEKTAILKAATEMGIAPDSTTHQCLTSWLESRPTQEAVAAWDKYVRAICATLEPATIATLKSGTIGRAEKVASAAGGFLGLGSKISTAERECLDRLATAFSAS